MDENETIGFRWCEDAELAEAVAAFFVANVDPNYISHSDIQWGRATAPGIWSDTLLERVRDLARRAAGSRGVDRSDTAIRLALAHHGNVLKGIAFVTLNRRQAAGFAVLEDLVIARDARGQRIGSAFVSWISHECLLLGIDQIFLESAIGNIRAHEMFERAGFTTTSLVMRKALAKAWDGKRGG